ncbi:ATP-binding protein [Planococcus koreensis]|uniref:ATP-binding protein n=1 Tax=Planococcus koreensis TaxID=112331 RepID=UPI0039FD14C3
MSNIMQNQETVLSEMRSYVPAHLAIEAMRDNGYKNPAYAIAELIDNSIQADAKTIELLCAERETIHSTRKTLNLEQIAILDDGAGMEREVLKMSLQFGNGTRLERKLRTGMGRFGMGLPASSISQCRRVEVWSWTEGPENALCVHLDIDEIKAGINTSMPEPEKKEIPNLWLKNGNHFGKSGTLVVWSKLDRVIWRKGKTIIDNSEKVIGRMYRKFLNTGNVSIRMMAFDLERTSDDQHLVDKYALPNDPMYLMDKTSCPAPFDNQAMFQPFPNRENHEIKFPIHFKEEDHYVTVSLSYAKEDARKENNAGSQPHGKHAQSNEGISIVRAGRELDIDKTLLISHDTTERWWGVEVEFPPSLDEIMGVSNNKQTARNFTMALQATRDIEDVLSKSKKTYSAHIAELEEEGDPSAPLLDICMKINNQLRIMREAIKKQTKGLRSTPNTRHADDINSPEKKASDLTKDRIASGKSGVSDSGESLPKEKQEEEIKETLTQTGFSDEEAGQIAVAIARSEIKYHFETSSFDGSAFFAVKPAGGKY